MDWAQVLKGKITAEKTQVLLRTLMPLYNAANNQGTFNHRRMAELMNLEGLAAFLAQCDPSRPKTDDHIQCIQNITNLFPHLAPALVHGGVHTSLLTLLSGCNRRWAAYSLSLHLLQSLVNGCAASGAGMDPFGPQGLCAVVAAFAGCLEQEVREGLRPELGQAVAVSARGLFLALRYCGHPASEAAKRAMRDRQLPGTLLRVAQFPAADFGHLEGRHDVGLCHYLEGSADILRALGSLLQSESTQQVVEMHAEMLEREGAFQGHKSLLKIGCDLMFSRRYWVAYLDLCQEAGAPLVRNVLSAVVHGAHPPYMTPAGITRLKQAGKAVLIPPGQGGAAVAFDL